MDSHEKTQLKTLAACMNKLQNDGFQENFMVKERGLCALDADKTYSAEEVKIVNFYRFEGESDPADSAILYAIETNDGLRGMLSDAYGPYADSKVTKFIADVEEIMKKTTPGEKI
ncbi:MAG: hypothetical protein M3R27_07480 [Bacteroidota bacterium]|nr:hypothetical protein [Bacteroidota bacterium]